MPKLASISCGQSLCTNAGKKSIANDVSHQADNSNTAINYICRGATCTVYLFLIYGELSFGDSDVYIKDGLNLFEKGFVKSDIYTPLCPIWTYLSNKFIGLQCGYSSVEPMRRHLLQCFNGYYK